MRRRGIWRPLAVGVAVAAVLIAAQLLQGDRSAAPGGGEVDAYWEGLTTAGLTIGRADAPVLVEEYFDFQCPHCHNASEEIVKPFIRRVVTAGDARFAYRLFPILGPESVSAAQGAYCAAKQGRFWPFQDVLFRQRGTGNRGTYSASKLQTYAASAELDVDDFGRCLTSEEARVYVGGAYQKGMELGIPGTPMFFVNGAPVSVRSLDELIRAVEAAAENG